MQNADAQSLTRVLHVNKAYEPHVGGVETVCRQYVGVSKSCFTDIRVLTISDEWGFGWHEDIIDRVAVRRCRWNFKIGGHKFSLVFIWQLISLAARDTVLHVHDPFPLATLALLVVRTNNLLITYHSDIVRQGFLKKPVDYLRLKIMRRAKHITVTSRRLLQSSNLLSKLPKENVSIVHLYLDDIEGYRKPSIITAKSDIHHQIRKDPRPFLLMVGRMNYYKGLDVVLNALRHNESLSIPNRCRLVIAGANTDAVAKASSDRLREFRDDVLRIDRAISEDEKLYLLQNCAALLFPSNKPTEAFGIVQMEAMAAGAPVINFDLPSGVPQVSIDQVTGFTFAVNDAVSIARVIANKDDEMLRLQELKANLAGHLDTNFGRDVIETNLKAIYGSVATI